jgi:spore coat protein U-like protein
MSLSTGSSGSFAARKLSFGASALQYNLYQTAAYQVVWGDGTGGSSASAASLHLTPAAPVQQVVQTIYGQISPGQDVSPGSYLDTIIVTVNY